MPRLNYYGTPGQKWYHRTSQSLLLVATHFWIYIQLRQRLQQMPALSKGFTVHPKAQVHLQEVPEGPWQLIGVDLIGPLLMSRGKDMILNIVDHYTKQIHLFPVTSQITSDGVASIYFDHVFPLHGIPHKIISDRGPQFASTFW